MHFGRCPNQDVLEKYYYNHLPWLKLHLVRRHVRGCMCCQRNLNRVEEFDMVLSNIPYEEPPPGLCSSIIEFAQETTSDTISGGVENEGMEFWNWNLTAKIRWVLSAVLLLAKLAFAGQYMRFGGGFAPYTQAVGWSDLRFVYKYFRSGELLYALRQILVAVRANAIFVFEIMNDVLPDGFFNVIIFGGLALVTWMAHLLVTRNEVKA